MTAFMETPWPQPGWAPATLLLCGRLQGPAASPGDRDRQRASLALTALLGAADKLSMSGPSPG